jgi:protease PrsW
VPTGDRDPDRTRRRVGLALWIVGVLGGIALNLLFTFLEIRLSPNPGRVASAMIQGAIPAFAMLLVYLPIPAVLDRYDPEPWWSLAMAFAWGAFVATGVAGTFNTIVNVVVSGVAGEGAGRFVMTVFAAPFSEEIMKGLAILGFFYFLRREFDGVVDGILYASFCALGFAAVENVSYYARAALESQDQFTAVFVLRGIIAPWGHPLYTAMTGIGFGVSRETDSPFWRKAAPVAGLSAAMFLHALWNFVPNLGGAVFVVSLLFWFVFVFAFLIILIVLVRRKGKVIADHLKDELMIGNLTPYEFTIVTSAFGNLQTYVMPKGATWRKLIRAAGRLALCKWHTARAMRGRKRTFSIEFIAPLREEMQALRAELARR